MAANPKVFESAEQLDIVHERGNRWFDDLPEDIQAGAQRDFGGLAP